MSLRIREWNVQKQDWKIEYESEGEMVPQKKSKGCH